MIAILTLTALAVAAQGRTIPERLAEHGQNLVHWVSVGCGTMGDPKSDAYLRRYDSLFSAIHGECSEAVSAYLRRRICLTTRWRCTQTIPSNRRSFFMARTQPAALANSVAQSDGHPPRRHDNHQGLTFKSDHGACNDWSRDRMLFS